MFASVLVCCHDGLQDLDELLFQLPCQKLSTRVRLSDLLQSLVILEEEGEVLEGDVHVAIPSLLPVFLHCHPTSGVRVLVDLRLDLFWCVGQVNGCCGVARTHLCLRSLEGWDEPRVYECGLGAANSWGHIPRHPEVWVLVDGAWDHTGYVLAAAEDLWEGATEGGSSLYRRETDLPNTVGAAETKDALRLVEGDTLLDA